MKQRIVRCALTALLLIAMLLPTVSAADVGVKFSAKIQSITAGDTSVAVKPRKKTAATVFMVGYDADGAMIGIQSKTTTNGSTKSMSFDYMPTAKTIKFMVVDDSYNIICSPWLWDGRTVDMSSELPEDPN